MDAATSANALENHIHEIAKNLHRTLKSLNNVLTHGKVQGGSMNHKKPDYHLSHLQLQQVKS